MTRTTEALDALTQSLRETDENVTDLTEDLEEIRDRLDELEIETSEHDSGDVDDSMVDVLADLHAALLLLARVTAAAVVIEHSYAYSEDGFSADQRRAAKRTLGGQVGGSW